MKILSYYACKVSLVWTDGGGKDGANGKIEAAPTHRCIGRIRKWSEGQRKQWEARKKNGTG